MTIATPMHMSALERSGVLLLEEPPAARLAFRLTPATIRALVPAGTAGTYLLLVGARPIYVGRSDHCLQTRLASHNHRDEATHVLWEAASDPWEAFLLEAWWWHRHAESLINKIHPASPTGTNRCPFCDSRTAAGLNRALRPTIHTHIEER